MSHIDRIITLNTKGRNFALELDPLTLAVGPNYSGKTTLLDSIRLALVGRLPEAAKNADIFLMSSGVSMSIALHLSDGMTINRDYTKDGDSIRSTGTYADEWTTPLLNSAEYFGLTAGERLNYIAARMEAPEKTDGRQIYHQLIAALAVAEIDATIDEVKTMTCGVSTTVHEYGAQDGINRLLDKKAKGFTLPNQFTFWNSVVKDRVGAVRTLAELKNREGECSAETLGEIREEIATIQKDLSEATERKGKFQNAKETSEKTAARRKQLTEWMAKPKGAHATAATDYRAKFEKEKAKFHTFGMRGDGSAAMQPVLDGLRQTMLTAEMHQQQARNMASEIREQIEELSAMCACPTCQAKKKGWQKVALEAFQAKLSEATAKLEKCDTEVEQSTKAFKLMEATVAARKMQEVEEREVEASMKTFEAAVIDQESKDAEEKRAVENFTAELQTINATPFDPDDLAGALGDVTRQENLLAAAQERLQTATKLQQQIVSAVEAQEEYEKAKVALEAAKLIGTFLREKQQEGTNAIISGLLDVVNFFTKGIMVAPLALHESEIGYWLPSGRFVQHDTFSGLEKLLTYFAMGCALSTKGKLRIALLDELGNLTAGMRHAVLHRAREAVAAGMLDQVIGVLPVDPDEKVLEPFWKVIVMEGKK